MKRNGWIATTLLLASANVVGCRRHADPPQVTMPGMPGMMPGQMPGQMPGMMPGMMPGQMPGQMPGMMPGQMPGMQAMPGMPGMQGTAPSCAAYAACCTAMAALPNMAAMASSCGQMNQYAAMGAQGEMVCSQGLNALRMASSAMPGGTPAQCLGATAMPGMMPGQMPTQMPGQMPTQMPGQLLGTSAGALMVGGVQQGMLITGDQTVMDDGTQRLADEYQLTLTAGQAVTIIARGGPSTQNAGMMLDVMTSLICNGAQVASDDDSAGNRNSRIVYVPPMSSVCTLRVMGFAGDQGAYTVQVYPGALPMQT